MKLGVISYPDSINIGDEVQSVAAKRLLPQVDAYIPREGVDKFSSEEKVKLICNGWFTEAPNNWPPSNDIVPLFISMHVTKKNNSYKKLINSELKDYYKQFEPIGCRDIGTLKMFQSIGVEAYFSNCLTLTLDNQFNERNDKILIVDPFRRNFNASYRDALTKALVPEKYQHNVEYIEQRRYNVNASVEQRFTDAEALIEKYSKAKLVVTSRIHCALPCLALGTPVYFVDAGYDNISTMNDRFEGIIDLFNVIDDSYFPYTGNSLKDFFNRYFKHKDLSLIKPLPINWENPDPNPVDISKIKADLKKKVADFIKD